MKVFFLDVSLTRSECAIPRLSERRIGIIRDLITYSEERTHLSEACGLMPASTALLQTRPPLSLRKDLLRASCTLCVASPDPQSWQEECSGGVCAVNSQIPEKSL